MVALSISPSPHGGEGYAALSAKPIRRSWKRGKRQSSIRALHIRYAPFGLSLSKPCSQYNQPFDSFRANKYHPIIQPQGCPHKIAKPRNFAEQLIRTAQQKLTAATARNNPSMGAKKPRDVILAACTAIGDQLAGDGFAFRKSGPSFKRLLGDFTHEIHIQSDRNNIAGQRAAIWIHASISSSQMATWRRNNPMPWNGTDKAGLARVIGGQIGNLLPRPDWMEWDFADDRRRQTVMGLSGFPCAAGRLIIRPPWL